MENRSNRVWWLVAVGGLLGTLLTTWLAPKVISWYFEPPAQFGFNCVAPIQWALTRFQWAQAGGLIGGGVLGLIAAILLSRRRKSTSYPTTPTANY